MKITHRKRLLQNTGKDVFNTSGLLYISSHTEEFYHLEKLMLKLEELKSLSKLEAIEIKKGFIEDLRKELGWTTHILDGVLGLKKEWTTISHKGNLSKKETKNLFSVLMVYKIGIEVFDSAAAFSKWMFTGHKNLDGLQPVVLLTDPLSTNIVERMLHDLEKNKC